MVRALAIDDGVASDDDVDDDRRDDDENQNENDDGRRGIDVTDGTTIARCVDDGAIGEVVVVVVDTTADIRLIALVRASIIVFVDGGRTRLGSMGVGGERGAGRRERSVAKTTDDGWTIRWIKKAGQHPTRTSVFASLLK
jgi:hypothetical protein